MIFCDGRRQRIFFCLLFSLSSAYASAAVAQQSKVKRFIVDDATSMDEGRVADTQLRLRYSQALMARIREHWRYAGVVSTDAVCPVKVRQIPGGEVISVEAMSDCPYDDKAKRSVEAAILMSQPLPYRGFEPVFSRTLILRFRANDPD